MGSMAPQGPHGPMDRMGRWDDPELAEIFGDEPDLYELSRTVRAARPESQLGPHFEPYLRAKLMDAAARELRPRGMSRWLRPRAGLFATGGTALGLAMIAAVVVTTVVYHPNDTVHFAYTANVAENHQVSPDDVIRVSFSQAVDHTAIEHSLQIHPATAVQTRWEGTTLVITPLHHLAANTPYTVTIPHAAVRDTQGHGFATADIHIAFGTAATPAPTPSAAPATPPALQPQAMGPVSGDSSVLIAPDGTVVATSGLVQSTQNGAVIGVPGVTGLTSPAGLLPGGTLAPGHGNQPTATPAAGSPTGSPAPATARLVQFGGPNGTAVLGPATHAAAYSPSGRSLAYLVSHDGSASLVVARADGSNPTTLVRNADAASPLAWADEGDLVYLSAAERVSTVDLEGRSRPLGGVTVGEGQDLALAPGGQVAYVGPVPSAVPSASPSGDIAATPSPTASGTPSPEIVGHLVDLGTGALRPLPGIRQLPAFSADGSTVAWVDESGTTPVLDVMGTADPNAAPATVPTAAVDGDTLGNLGLSGDGSRLAYTLAHGDTTPALRVAAASTGATIAVGDGQPVASPVLSSGGDRIAFLRATSSGVVAAEALIPGSQPAQPAADAAPADAAALLDQFVAAQVKHDLATLRSLAASSLTVDTSLTPDHVTRTYVIKATLDQRSQAVTADVRLVRDASGRAPTSSADETLELARPAAGQPFQVTAVSIADFASAPAGPQVVHVTTERDQLALVVRIAFDSDLDPSSVSGSVITLAAANGVALPADVRYDVESRTAVVRLLSVPAGTLTLSVGTALQDIAGQSLASGYSTTVSG